MSQNDQIDQIISLIFTLRILFHEKFSGKGDSKISLLQFITLRKIKEKKPLMKDIAEYLDIAPPSATSLVESLIEEKLVKRITHPQDRRIVQIVITEKGEKEIQEKIKAIHHKMRLGIEKLSAKEQEQLVEILAKVVENHKKIK